MWRGADTRFGYGTNNKLYHKLIQIITFLNIKYIFRFKFKNVKNKYRSRDEIIINLLFKNIVMFSVSFSRNSGRWFVSSLTRGTL